MGLLFLDNIADIDLLNRKAFAKQIIKCLTSSFDKVDESIVVGICGKWGSGKSTLLKYIDQSIRDHYSEDQERFRIVNFNPWANTGVEDLQRSLLETLLKELQNIKWKNNLEQANDTFKGYLKYLDYLKFVKYVHPVAEKIFDAADQYSKDIKVISLDDLKNKINALIEEEEIKLYIVIDDLDRLEHSEITAIFKTIKLNVNFKNTHFLVAYDKPVVINALSDTYKDNAEGYLEKIIQVDFTIPEISEEQIENMFFDQLQRSLQHLDLQYKSQALFSIWKYKGLREYFRNPRDIKRYFNSLALSLPNIGMEVNLVDFLVLEAIKVFDFFSYERLYQTFIETKRKAVWQSASFNSEVIDKYFEKSKTKAILHFLFLEDAKPLGDSINQKRLRDIEFFDRYFSLHIRKSDVTEDALHQFLSIGTNKHQLLDELLQNGRMRNFLRRLSDNRLMKTYQVNDYSVFKVFLHFWDSNISAITSDIEEDIWNSYFNLAQSFDDKNKAAKIAIEQLRMSENSFEPMRLIFNYFIVAYEGAIEVKRQFQGALNDQLNILHPYIEKHFTKCIEITSEDYLTLILKGEGTYACHLFFHSLAIKCRSLYLKEIAKHLSNENLLVFLLKNNFVRFDVATNKIIRISLQHTNLLLPETWFQTFLQNLKNFKRGVVNESDADLIHDFLSHFDSNNELIS